mgnify:CR=1 FL=1
MRKYTECTLARLYHLRIEALLEGGGESGRKEGEKDKVVVFALPEAMKKTLEYFS